MSYVHYIFHFLWKCWKDFQWFDTGNHQQTQNWSCVRVANANFLYELAQISPVQASVVKVVKTVAVKPTMFDFHKLTPPKEKKKNGPQWFLWNSLRTSSNYPSQLILFDCRHCWVINTRTRRPFLRRSLLSSPGQSGSSWWFTHWEVRCLMFLLWVPFFFLSCLHLSARCVLCDLV